MLKYSIIKSIYLRSPTYLFPTPKTQRYIMMTVHFLQNLLFFTLWTNFDSLVFHPSYYIPAHLQFLHLCSPQSLTCGLSHLPYRQVMKEMTHRLTQFELILWQFAIDALFLFYLVTISYLIPYLTRFQLLLFSAAKSIPLKPWGI